MTLDALRVVEACYASAADDASWLAGLVDALAPLGHDHGLLAAVVRAGGPAPVAVECAAARGAPRSCSGPALEALLRTLAPAELACALGAAPAVDWAGRRAGRAGVAIARRARAALRALGAEDALWIAATGPGARAAVVAVTFAPGAARPGPRTLHRLGVFAAHLGSALRLRSALRGAEREGLAAAARRLGADGLGARRSDPEDTLRLWAGLVGGTWSLVDGCDADGRRYVLARRNAPGVRDPKALTSRERAVLALAAMGHQNKSIGYLLGCSTSAVARHVEAACRKLALASRADLVRRFAALVDGPERA